MSGIIGFAVYNYLDKMDGTNLNLADSGRDTNMTCLVHWLERGQDLDSLWASSELAWSAWIDYRHLEVDEFLQKYSCQPKNPHLMATSCKEVKIPPRAFTERLGYPLGEGEDRDANNDMLHWFAYLFAALGTTNLIGFIVHDMTLIHNEHKDYVLDWPGFNDYFPSFGHFRLITGLKCLHALFTATGNGRKIVSRICGVLLTPVVVVWATFAYSTILTPIMLLVYLRYPVRLSRFQLFVTLVATGIYGLCLTITSLVYLVSDDQRPRFALKWSVGGIEADIPCHCGCSYDISNGSLSNLLLIGVGVTFQSILTAFRCLKGLRRAQWANLMSVTFPVPVAAYEVMWTKPDGNPIQHRKDGEAVQAEKAFDPFALMDEQAESRYTTVTLKPEFAYDVDQLGRWKPRQLRRSTTGPALQTLQKGQLYMQPTEVIGCCGFPCLTGGYQAILVDDSDQEEQFEAEAGKIDAETHGAIIGKPISSSDLKLEEPASPKSAPSSRFDKRWPTSPSGASEEDPLKAKRQMHRALTCLAGASSQMKRQAGAPQAASGTTEPELSREVTAISLDSVTLDSAISMPQSKIETKASL